jgi:small-conductance mechanosensitive channel
MSSLRWTACLLVLGLLLGCEGLDVWDRDGSDSTAAVPDTVQPAAAPADTAAPDTASADTLAGPPPAGTTETAATETTSASADPSARADTLTPDGSTAAASTSDTSTAATSTAADSASNDDSALEEAGEAARSYGYRFAGAVLVFLLTFFAIKGVVYVLETLSERSAERRLLYKRIVPIARIVMWALALYIVLRGIFNVDGRSLLAAATAIGVAVGFAAQDILKNIFGGLVIIFDTPFQVGDKISVGGTYGEVIAIGLRSTRIVTPDDNLVSVPNAQIVDGQVSNANAGALDCQVVTDLYLPGWVDEEKAKSIAYDAAASSKYTYLKKPIAVIVKDEFDDGHVVHLKVKAYVLDARFEFLLASDVTERARRAFRAQGLLLPATRSFIDLPASPQPPTGTGTVSGDAGPPASGSNSAAPDVATSGPTGTPEPEGAD